MGTIITMVIIGDVVSFSITKRAKVELIATTSKPKKWSKNVSNRT